MAFVRNVRSLPHHRRLGRRRALATLAGTFFGPGLARATEPPPGLRLFDWTWPSLGGLVRRAVVLAPTHVGPGERVGTLVAVHGLGEARQGARAGAYAWLERYGLGEAYARLRRPPVGSVQLRHDLTAERAAAINAELSGRPFAGLVLACPAIPDVWATGNVPATLDALAEFFAGPLLERVRREVPEARRGEGSAGLDGCSLGGFVALEVARRRPDAWGAVGVVQPAIGAAQAARYAEALAARPGRPVHVASSRGDPYLGASRRLADELSKRGVVCDLSVSPGPHDQPFLRDAGALEMLLWHDRRLNPG
jgi:enterochelin esterase-like enzyme